MSNPRNQMRRDPRSAGQGNHRPEERIREIADLLVVDRLRNKFGIEPTRPILHMSFAGSPGTRKTTVAWRMAELLNRRGIWPRGAW